jgi:hypothetical protein
MSVARRQLSEANPQGGYSRARKVVRVYHLVKAKMIVFTDTYVRSVVDTGARGRWSGPMANQRSTSGKRGLRAVSSLLGKGVSPWAPAWSVVVGAATARTSVCLGPNEQGALRVMTRTSSECEELLAREGYILAAWNQWAVEKRQPVAESFACWVYEGIYAEEPRGGPTSVAPIEDRWIDAAEADIPATEHSGVREAVVMARARLLRRRERDRQARSKPIEQDTSNE